MIGMSIPSRKLLGRLETPDRNVIAVGGAQLNADGTGFFITETGTDLMPVAAGQSGLVCSSNGEVFAAVNDLHPAAASLNLPRRYVFTHGETINRAELRGEETLRGVFPPSTMQLLDRPRPRQGIVRRSSSRKSIQEGTGERRGSIAR